MRLLMQRFERRDTKSRRDPAIVGELRAGTDDLAAKADSAAVILQSHASKAVREWLEVHESTPAKDSPTFS
ncbi:hypothetical protein ACFU98_13195 [Streptomyces sp. NPDC057575]|uniref:hypothetical protein n=1 Tax=unclassified Streptomyces TaxID=2593676 RepID=UPI0036C4B08A